MGEQKPRTAWSAEPAHPPLSQTAGVQESRGVCVVRLDMQLKLGSGKGLQEDLDT